MASIKSNIVNGIESVEFAFINPDGSVNEASWQRMEDIEDGSVSLASTQDTETSIIPEDKDTAILIIRTPGTGDVYNFALLQVSAENLERFWNTKYDASTSTVTVKSKKKYANLALRFTSRPQEGLKKIFTFKNTTSVATWKNTITKTGLLAISVAATILSWKDADNEDAVFTVQTVNEDGSTINSVVTLDTILDFTSSASNTAEGVTGTSGTTNATKKFAFNAIDNPTGTGQSMTLKLAGVNQLVVDYPGDYQGEDFKYTDATGGIHYGQFANGNVNL